MRAFQQRSLKISSFVGAVLLSTSFASAQQLKVITVPWLGETSLQHAVYTGGTLNLQGVARPIIVWPITAATWDPGDGTGPVAIPFGDPRASSSARLRGVPTVHRDPVRDGQLRNDGHRQLPRRHPGQEPDVEVDMAIDHGLWALHKRQIPGTSGGIDTGYWSGYHLAAGTATSTQAFEINGHLEFDDDDEDPYADTVRRGIAYTFTTLSTLPGIANEPFAGGDADSNGNGIGLYYAESFREVYVLGQIVDAIVAGGNPLATATTGGADVIGREYGAIVQDCMDSYHYAQNNTNTGGGRGSFYYTFNGGAGDNSTAQWWAIGGLGADRTFGTTYPGYVKVPQWVKDENLNAAGFLRASQTFGGADDGRFGYQSINPIDVNGMNTTPSGMVQPTPTAS
jgi:hypothetical protein